MILLYSLLIGCMFVGGYETYSQVKEEAYHEGYLDAKKQDELFCGIKSITGETYEPNNNSRPFDGKSGR